MSDPERGIDADLFRATRTPPRFGRLTWWSPQRSKAESFAITPCSARAARSGAVYAVRIQVPASQIADITDDTGSGSSFDRLEREFDWSAADWMAAQDPPWEPIAGLKLLRRHMSVLRAPLAALAAHLANRGYHWLVLSVRYPVSTQIEWLRLVDEPPLEPVLVR